MTCLRTSRRQALDHPHCARLRISYPEGMSGLSLSLLIAVAATFFVAGLVKGVTGMGLPTVAMGVLGTLMPPAGAAALLLVPSFVTNVWQLLAGPSFATLARRLWPMLAGIVAGTLLGASLMTGS